MNYDVIIIGGGPAGLTSAIYAGRAGYKTALIEMGSPGGQAATTEIIDNYPGYPEGITGPELMLNFHKQAKRFGCEFITAQVTGIEQEGSARIVKTSQGQKEAKAVIVATGAVPGELGVKGEKEFRGRGVSYCATCDGFFFRNKKVAVVGGGNAAVEEAIFLSELAKEIVIIHRRDDFRADKILKDKALEKPNVSVMWDTVVEGIVGENKLEKIELKNVKSQEKTELQVDGVFLYVGTKPNTDFLGSLVDKDAKGYILTDENLKTSVPGIFAVGDCRQKRSRQVATAVGDGAAVMIALDEYLQL